MVALETQELFSASILQFNTLRIDKHYIEAYPPKPLPWPLMNVLTVSIVFAVSTFEMVTQKPVFFHDNEVGDERSEDQPTTAFS